jgi:hypothetical protein
MAALRAIGLHCDYGDRLSEMLRDRLVCGVNHKGITDKLLSTPDLTYEQAMTLAQSLENSEKDAEKLPSPIPSQEEHAFMFSGGHSGCDSGCGGSCCVSTALARTPHAVGQGTLHVCASLLGKGDHGRSKLCQ